MLKVQHSTTAKSHRISTNTIRSDYLFSLEANRSSISFSSLMFRPPEAQPCLLCSTCWSPTWNSITKRSTISSYQHLLAFHSLLLRFVFSFPWNRNNQIPFITALLTTVQAPLHIQKGREVKRKGNSYPLFGWLWKKKGFSLDDGGEERRGKERKGDWPRQQLGRNCRR